jgi:membrane associated rhomboid family serine protease
MVKKSNKKTNGSGPDKKIIRLPTLAERDRMRKTKKNEEKIKQPPLFNLSKIPLFTRAVVALFVIIHVALTLTLSLPSLYGVWNVYGFVPGAFTGARPFTWETALSPVTHMFIHGSWMHLFFNTTMALVMGMAFETRFGAKTAAFFFFASGFAGALLYFILQPFSEAQVIGASGAISGWFGAMIVVFYHQRPGMRKSRLGAWPIIGFWVMFFIAMGLIGHDSMAWQAHVGGLLAGIGLLHLLEKGKMKFLF